MMGGGGVWYKTKWIRNNDVLMVTSIKQFGNVHKYSVPVSFNYHPHFLPMVGTYHLL